MNKTPNLDLYLGQLHAEKINLVTASILDGVMARLKERGTLTPKQTAWITDRYIATYTKISKVLGSELMLIMETGGTLGQKIAEKHVRNLLQAQPAEVKTAQFNNLFEIESKLNHAVHSIQDAQHYIQQLK